MVSEADVVSTFPMMCQLWTHLKEDEYLEAVERVRRSGYRMAVAVDRGCVRCVAGFRIQEYLYCGRHLYVDGLITDGSARSQGYGKRMLDWLTGIAREEECGSLQLASGVQRHEAHRFYFRKRMNISSYHFSKSL